MNSLRGIHKLTGWLVFAIALVVYYFSAERTGSLWDCGEFILGAYKLQVVHPPGASLFVLIGRLFTWVASLVSDDPSDIAFSVNLMSSICTAFAAMFIAWITMMLGRLALKGREEELDGGESLVLAGAGLAAGLATAFATSVWFSAVEGEVYAMSTFFTTLTMWSMIHWYTIPDSPKTDRWLLFTIYMAGLSIGVHLLSLLTFPALALFYYFKRYQTHTFWGGVAAAAVGVAFIVLIQSMIIVGIPELWSVFELMMVNGLGLPFHTGLIPTVLVIGGFFVLLLLFLEQKVTSVVPLYLFGAVLVLATIYGYAKGVGAPFWQLFSAGLVFAAGAFRKTMLEKRREVQILLLGAALVVAGFSTIGVVVIRANADPPINMNRPSDAMRLIPYLNREQYGERALLFGPHFAPKSRPETDLTDRYGRVGDHYEITDYKINVKYDSRDKMLFPRMGDATQGRPSIYKQWMGLNPSQPLPSGRPNQIDNIAFMLRYQLGWMYWRYFMWNFSGRQNGEQGYYSWDKSSGNWITGIKFLDALRLGNQKELPKEELQDKSRNVYFGLPFLFGLLGLIFHFRERPNDALALLTLFVITGIGIIIYSNQPPNEPRERDYVLAGSFFTFCIWIGMGALFLFRLLQGGLRLNGTLAAAVASAVVLAAPALMGFQNFDDHSRRDHYASRDYASNFLNSVEKDAIIFTYGDNDTYPLWYSQEVEGIRTDVRVVNLSLIAVDWYIDLLRRKVNESPAVKMTLPPEAYRGSKRNQVFYYPDQRLPKSNQPVTLKDFMQLIAMPRELQAGPGRTLEGFYETRDVYIPVNKEEVLAAGVVGIEDTARIVNRIPLKLENADQLIKDEVAILDILASNLWERPIYFAVTCRPEKFFGLDDYMQLEGLAVRIVPVRSPSDRIYGVVGSGRVATDKLYENIMNEFRWGNFDKEDVFVDKSYMPSIQSMQLAMRRGAFSLLREGKKEEAINLVDKFFEVFPEKNFPYDYRTMMMLDVYFQAGEYQKAKPVMEKLARETYDYLRYYESLDDRTLQSSYESDFGAFFNIMERLLEEARRAGDTEFVAQMENQFKTLMVFSELQQPQNELPVPPAGSDTLLD